MKTTAVITSLVVLSNTFASANAGLFDFLCDFFSWACDDDEDEVEAESFTCQTVAPLTSFDLDTFVSATWYVQEMQELLLQPDLFNYCATVEYEIDEDEEDELLVTFSFENEDGDDFSTERTAVLDGADDEAKFLIGPRFLPIQIFGNDHWVVDYNEDGGYAVVAAGEPTENPSSDGCRTSPNGLWILTRAWNPADGVVDYAVTQASNMGYDVTVLNTVDQGDCDW